MKKWFIIINICVVSSFAKGQTYLDKFNQATLQPGCQVSTLASPISGLSFTAAAKEQVAKASVGFSLGTRHAFSLNVTQRISGGSGSYTLLDLNGLRGNTKAGLDWRFTLSNLEQNNNNKTGTSNEPSSHSIFLVGGVTAANNNFRYLTDSLSTNIIEESKLDQQIKITLGYTETGGNEPMAFAISFLSSSRYIAQSQRMVLLPLPSGAYYEDETSFGNPTQKNSSIIRLEIAARYLATGSDGKKKVGFGGNPSFSYFLEEKRWGVEVPVYGISFDDNGNANGITGGLIVGYLSPGEVEAGMVTVKVFVGGALETLLQPKN